MQYLDFNEKCMNCYTECNILLGLQGKKGLNKISGKRQTLTEINKLCHHKSNGKINPQMVFNLQIYAKKSIFGISYPKGESFPC